jgi:putative transcriptional regulator
MSVRHHPDEELLQSNASGVGDAGAALLVATHLTFCARCRDEMSVLESLGGALLSETAPTALEDCALENAIARLEGAAEAKPVRVPAGSVSRAMPAPLRAYAGIDLDRVRWRPVFPGLSYRMLMKRGGTHVYLTRSTPGSSIGFHTHRGNELTLVLAGGFTDEAGSYAQGDLIATTPEIHHRPVADDDGDCITLSMTDAPLKFDNVGAGLLARIFGF